jgi:hypothetical protein
VGIFFSKKGAIAKNHLQFFLYFTRGGEAYIKAKFGILMGGCKQYCGILSTYNAMQCVKGRTAGQMCASKLR